MANTRLSMRKIKDVLRLTHDGQLNTHQVALSLNISRSFGWVFKRTLAVVRPRDYFYSSNIELSRSLAL
jgi:hypothetical protein